MPGDTTNWWAAYHDGTRVETPPEDSDKYARLATEMGYHPDVAALPHKETKA